MKYAAAALLLLVFSAPAAAQPGDALIARMIANSDGVKSYTAHVHTDATIHAMFTLTPSLDGTYYHREPDKTKVEYTSGIPLVAQQFNRLYPHIDSPSVWKERYSVTLVSDGNGQSLFKLVPRKGGRVDHIDARVDDRTAELLWLRWNYTDGGYAETTLSYSDVQGHPLITSQTGAVEVPRYSAEFTSRFSGFKLNVPIPDSVFAEN